MLTQMTAGAPGPSVGRWWNWLVRSRAWIGILLLLPFGFAAVFSPPHSPEGSWGDIGLDIPGWLLFMVGAALRWWATLYIGGRKSTSVITEGPYSICRNPLYLGTFLMLMGFSFYLESLTFAAGCVVAAVFYLSVTVSAEETRLRQHFGQPFVDYCRTVPRFWPRFRLFRSTPEIVVSVRGLRSEAYRAARWIWLPLLGEIVAQCRTEAWFPRWFHMP
ncbi:MAG TPA: isoprenylcysteine carboxylmethyltransferase family protein [Pirellulales bacterium]|jgi:protein-S-isoprenylcysteine O-methyltransferase Ste14|nr:isoprenylcysteine carboxylmethyltransferase family protein [Pirellulales bacterium]